LAVHGFEAVVFDFDGLLLDTETCSIASWQYEWRQHGLELDVDTFWVDHGGDMQQVRYAALASAVGPAYDHATSHARRIAFRDDLLSRLSLEPGMDQWLADAAAMDLRLAIASSSSSAWVQRLLTAVDAMDVFECFACGDDVAAPKPDPAVYTLALTRLGLPPNQVVAIEDAPHGVSAAQAAGMRCIAIPSVHRDATRFAHADLVLRSATEMTLQEALAAVV
jgi:putative hydrolase of the HAD superfamily